MASSYTQVHLQYIFITRKRSKVITEDIRDEVQKYMVGLFQERGCKVLEIYCNPDHVHVLVRLNPLLSMSEIAQAVKSYTSKWINRKGLTQFPFYWQSGYAAFSYSKSAIPNVIRYIRNQPIHHANKDLKSEYEQTLKSKDEEFDLRYMFDKD